MQTDPRPSSAVPAATPPTGMVAIVGAGTMGAGIAQVALEAGWRVRLHDGLPAAATRGRRRIADGLRRRAASRRLAGRAATTWVRERLGRLDLVRSAAAAADGADLAIEAIVEDLAAKRELFAALDAAAPRPVILATNTSALSVGAIAEAARRHPDRVIGLHFFNPAPLLRLVEVVAGERTSPVVVERATAIVEAWARTPVRATDTPGFIVNRVNRPFTIDALRMVEAGEAGVAEIDGALRDEGFPMGPFELMDLVGLDVNLAAATGVWVGLGRPARLRPSPIQEWLVREGRLGRKAGVGFYDYAAGHDPVPKPLPAPVAARPRRDPADRRAIAARIRAALLHEAELARDAGVATEADIDTALWLGAGHPEGPFAWHRRHDPTIGR